MRNHQQIRRAFAYRTLAVLQTTSSCEKNITRFVTTIRLSISYTIKGTTYPVILHNFSSLDNTDYYDNECNYKQGVNEPTCIKYKET